MWDPKIEVINEFSLSQIWVLSGSFDGSDLNSIEAGWQVRTPPSILLLYFQNVYVCVTVCICVCECVFDIERMELLLCQPH